MATLTLHLPIHRVENNKSVETQKRLNELKTSYLLTLDRHYFQGGWCEEPKYPASDYQAYSDWLQQSGNLTQPPFGGEYDIQGLGKAVLIGANKIFGVLDGMEGRYNVTTPGTLELRLHDDTKVRIRHPDDPNHYRYKELYVQQPGDFLIHLRAGSTYEFGGLSVLGKRRNLPLKDSSTSLGQLLGVFVDFHHDILE